MQLREKINGKDDSDVAYNNIDIAMGLEIKRRKF